jgi:hypothetical protein
MTPIGRKPLCVLRMESVAEGMCDDIVCHDLLVPCTGESTNNFTASDGFK